MEVCYWDKYQNCTDTSSKVSIHVLSSEETQEMYEKTGLEIFPTAVHWLWE
jgi:hypothetical protein